MSERAEFSTEELASFIVCGHTHAPWLPPCPCSEEPEEVDGLAPGTRVEVHEVEGGYVVIPVDPDE